jgi:hypothetical protein
MDENTKRFEWEVADGIGVGVRDVFQLPIKPITIMVRS